MAVTIAGLDELVADLDEAARRAGSQPPVWPVVGRLLVAGAKRRVPVRSGRLQRSIGADPGRNGVEVDATAPYAAEVDARTPFLAPTEAELDRVDALIADYVVAPLAGRDGGGG